MWPVRSTTDIQPILPPLGGYWHFASTLRSRWHQYRYGAESPVFILASVSPKAISSYSNLPGSNKQIRRSFGIVQPGDWDREDTSEVHPYLDETEVPELDTVNSLNPLLYPSIKAKFQDGIPWEQTLLVRYVSRRIERGERLWHGCSTMADVYERCRFLERLHASMRRDGYRSQLELAQDGAVRKSFIGAMRNEIVVDLTRDGRFLFIDGIHRLSMARMLDLESITVSIVRRHPLADLTEMELIDDKTL